MLSLQITLGEAKVLKVTIQIEHVRDVSDGSSSDRIVAQIKNLQRFVSCSRIGWVRLQSLAYLLHIII
jgi:hypothetical protein